MKMLPRSNRWTVTLSGRSVFIHKRLGQLGMGACWLRAPVLVVILILPAVVQAQWEWRTNYDHTITIMEYTGPGGDVVIPSTIDDLPVTRIDGYAFYYCGSLGSVTIPDSVTSIGPEAFDRCASLTTITVDPLNSFYSSVDGVLFNKSQTTLIQYPRGKAGGYAIPNSVTNIGYEAFFDCTSLTSVTIPDSVTSIAEGAFSACRSLTRVWIGNGITRIGVDVFSYCLSLTSVTIPDSVTNIGGCAFSWCRSLSTVTIPDSVTSIEGDAFFNCRSLTSVTIPGSVTSIGAEAFDGCASLTTIVVDPLNSFYSSDDGVLFDKGQTTLLKCPEGKTGSYTIPDSVTTIKDHAFDSCTSLSNVIIPNSVTSIGYAALQACASLTSVTIGSSVTGIKEWTFADCTSLTNVTIPDSVRWIYDGAFSGCTSLISVTIGKSVTYIEETVFLSCRSLTTIAVDPLNSFYSSVDGVLFDKTQTILIQCPAARTGICTIPASVTGIREGAFADCTSLIAISVDPLNSFYSSVDGVFFNRSQTILIHCPAVKGGSYTIPESVTSIGPQAFSGCTSLTSVTIPESVTNIGHQAFSGCTSLTSISIPGSVSCIRGGTFSDCRSLTRVTIPDSVSSIGGYAFSGCTSLTSISIPESVSGIWGGTFFGCSSLTRVTIPDSVSCIGPQAFSGCTSLTSVAIGNGVTSIGDDAFSDCAGLISVTIPESVTSIGYRAFVGCTSLTSITIAESVTSIGGLAFLGCTSLTTIMVDPFNSFYSSVDGVLFDRSQTELIQCPATKAGSYTVPKSVTTIEGAAFFSCSSLTSVTIPETVTSIGEWAFLGCTNLTTITVDPLNSFYGSVDGVLLNKNQTTLVRCPAGRTGGYTIPKSVTSIGDYAFFSCTSLTNVTIPDSVTYIEAAAFSCCSSLEGIYFQGKVPSVGSYLFDGANYATVYYLPGTMGWGATFADRPTAFWWLPYPLILNVAPTFGVLSNSFGFTVSWATNADVLIEACTDLHDPTWSAVGTNILTMGVDLFTDGWTYFSDPNWKNYPARFYRVQAMPANPDPAPLKLMAP
jgi:hypothetical protein